MKKGTFSLFIISIILLSFICAVLLYGYSEYQIKSFISQKEEARKLLSGFAELVCATDHILIDDDTAAVLSRWDDVLKRFDKSINSLDQSKLSRELLSGSEAFKKKTDDIFEFWKTQKSKIEYVRAKISNYLNANKEKGGLQNKSLLFVSGYQAGTGEAEYQALNALVNDIRYMLFSSHKQFVNMLESYTGILSELLDRRIYHVRFIVLVLFLLIILTAIFFILRSQKILSKTATQYRTLFEGANDTIFILKRDIFKECNLVTEKMFGASRENLINESIAYFCPEYQPDSIRSEEGILDRIERTLQGEPQKFEWRFQRIDGTQFDAAVSLNRIYIFPEVFVQAIIRDITDQKRALNALKRSEKKYRDLVENMEDGIFSLDTTGIVLTVNKAVERILHAEANEIIGTRFVQWVEDTNKEMLVEGLHEVISGERNAGRLNLIDKTGMKRIVEFTANAMRKDFDIIGVKGILRDVTEKVQAVEDVREAYEQLKNTQAQLIQSEKMAGVGQLAAGIAHEINNPTGFVISNLETLQYYSLNLFKIIFAYEDIIKKNLPEGEEKSKALLEEMDKLKQNLNFDYMKNDLTSLTSEVLEGANRIKSIVLNLKTFAHPDKEEVELADINVEVEKAFSLVWNELKYKCEVKKDYGDIPKIMCNPGQLVQVFVNLLINSSHAIEGEGKIEVKTYLKDDYIYLEFMDNGTGIEKENIEKIFDPFFTTKPVGEGTGLGLSIADKIIKNHKGIIKAESEPGKGAKFTIRLPVSLA